MRRRFSGIFDRLRFIWKMTILNALLCLVPWTADLFAVLFLRVQRFQVTGSLFDSCDIPSGPTVKAVHFICVAVFCSLAVNIQ